MHYNRAMHTMRCIAKHCIYAYKQFNAAGPILWNSLTFDMMLKTQQIWKYSASRTRMVTKEWAYEHTWWAHYPPAGPSWAKLVCLQIKTALWNSEYMSLNESWHIPFLGDKIHQESVWHSHISRMYFKLMMFSLFLYQSNFSPEINCSLSAVKLRGWFIHLPMAFDKSEIVVVDYFLVLF